MGKGIIFIGKAEEALIPVFGSDTRRTGCAYGGGTVGAVVGCGRHEDGQARDDVSNDFLAVSTGLDYVWSFGIVRDHAADFASVRVRMPAMRPIEA